MEKVSKRINFDGAQLMECPWHRGGRLKIFFQKWSISGPIFSMFPNINLFVLLASLLDIPRKYGKSARKNKFYGTQLLERPWPRDGRADF